METATTTIASPILAAWNKLARGFGWNTALHQTRDHLTGTLLEHLYVKADSQRPSPFYIIAYDNRGLEGFLNLIRNMEALKTTTTNGQPIDVLLVDDQPVFYTGHNCVGDGPAAGLLGELMLDSNAEYPSTAGLDAYAWGYGEWNTCTNCRSISIVHSYMGFNGRPCGCHDGDHYLGTPNPTFMTEVQSAYATHLRNAQLRYDVYAQ